MIPHFASYQAIANSFKIVDIAEFIMCRVSPNATSEKLFKKAQEKKFDWMYSPCIVEDEDNVYGYLFESYVRFKKKVNGTAKDYCDPITQNIIIPSSTPISDVFELLKHNYILFITSENKITHYLLETDLDKIPVHLCIFSLILELEEAILKYIRSSGKIDQFVTLLSNERTKKNLLRYIEYKVHKTEKILSGRSTELRLFGSEFFEKRIQYYNLVKTCLEGDYRDPKYFLDSPVIFLNELLDYTDFIDRKEMLIKHFKFNTKLPFTSNKKSNLFFKRVERIRNAIAHRRKILDIYDVDTIMMIIDQLKQTIIAIY